MAEAANHPRAIDRAAPWTLVLGVALGLRVVAAVVVWWYVRGKGTPCVFADTAIYRELARTIVAGEPYAVFQWGVPHYALRTPGYPLFLAACRVAFGDKLLAARLVQAILGTVAVGLVGKLAGVVVMGAGRTPLPNPLPQGARGSEQTTPLPNPLPQGEREPEKTGTRAFLPPLSLRERGRG